MARNSQTLLACPECASRDLQLRKPRGVFDFLLEIGGSYRWRCRNCQSAFRGNPLRLNDLWYAKCPRCLGQHLKEPEHHHEERPVPAGGARAALGAKRCECLNCGHQFASFRMVRHRVHQPTPLVTRGPRQDFQPMKVPLPLRNAWDWLRNPPRIVVRLRIRYRQPSRP